MLYRLKVILSELEDESISNWIDGEIQGYSSKDDVPSYRKMSGLAMGSFQVNGVTQYKNAQVPLEVLLSPEEIQELLRFDVTDSVITLQNIISSKNRENYGKVFPTAMCHAISDEQVLINGMKIILPSTRLESIVGKVKSKAVDIIIELDKRFDNLDELDISDQITGKKDKDDVAVKIEKIIYENSISIGDKNKISDSKIGRFFNKRTHEN